MGVTLTSALDRDTRRSEVAIAWWRSGASFLAASWLVGLLAIGLATAGRLQKSSLDDAGRTAVTNLNDVSSRAQLEPVLAETISDPGRRREAADALFQFIRRTKETGVPLANVAALLRVTPPLFSAADLATIKPSVVVRNAGEFRRRVMFSLLLFIAASIGAALVWRVRHAPTDLRLLAIVHVLTALGFAMLVSRPDPLRDALLFERYAEGVAIGLAIMALFAFIDFRQAVFLELSYVPLLLALGLSVLLLLFGDGPGTSGAKVNLGPVQPIEAIRLLLAFFLAGYFSRRWELLRQIRLRGVRMVRVPARLNLPRVDYVLPVVVGVGASLVFFFLQKDLGPALFLSCVFLAMYAIARGRWIMAATGFALLVGGFYAGYRLAVSATLVDRIRMWQAPWDNSVRGGAQVAQAIWALATGGVSGTGLGLGDTRYLPAGHTDLVLASLGEELGMVGLVTVIALYALLAVRGFRIARAASTDYGFFLATAVTLFLVLPVIVMGSGVLGLTPLTGVVTPFLSYGGSAMVANFAAIGILTAIDVSSRTRAAAEPATEPFRIPLRWVSSALGCAGVVLIVALVDAQVLRANAYVAKGHLTLQADGVRRYQYNQRLLDVARAIPRGSVFDRNGFVLATGDPALARRALSDFGKLHVAANATCLEPVERCYPLGGMAFHLLGDGTTRVNWSASNTSYVERDAEDRLRGFDDRAITLPSTDAAGRTTFTIRRDYGPLVPLLRHRYEPTHSAVQALLAGPRDERVTIDARLQVRVANILAAYASHSPKTRAAAVVLDPDTGDLLAVASYPWPAIGIESSRASTSPEALLDRARYGLYPPGSTFKLVTAIAALRQDSAARRAAFRCERLPDGRVGSHIQGWRRPVRDDVTDTHPHGTIAMREGLVESCNAYFAQLAVSIGPEALRDAANRVGVSLAPSNAPERLRQTLPQAGYGQGDVLATPLKMARIAGVFASGGILREPRWDANAVPPPQSSEALLAPEAADLVGQYLRDAVLTGTGRSLHANAGRIAGKTGTAEVSGAPSHSWFVGFAPHGAAKKRVAFAVIIEHAGYGSLAAAPVAGEIVDAAVAVGLVQ